MTPDANFLAVDLGAESCRAFAVGFDGERLHLEEVYRFNNGPVEILGGLYWNAIGIYEGILEALERAGASGLFPRSMGIDSWAVDFGLLDSGGELLSSPRNHRGPHTRGTIELVLDRVPAERIYGSTGIQFMPINTLCQLLGLERSPQLAVANRLLLVPDLMNYWLTGMEAAEYTNATTTQLYSHAAGDWDRALMNELGIPGGIFPEVVAPGSVLGSVRPEVSRRTGSPEDLTVVSVSSHDTASAVVAVPAEDEDFAYISSGTWSLVGVETDRAVLTAEAREANFTNEGGFGGKIRFLKNVMGLWILQECRRAWECSGDSVSYERLVALAREAEPFGFVFDPDSPELLAPGDMPARLRALCESGDTAYPEDAGAVTRGILESLALRYAEVLDRVAYLSGVQPGTVHVVGGGSRNQLLCQMTADATGLPVVAGPVEATAIGNALVQAHALGYISGLDEMRRVVRDSFPLEHYEPARDREAWLAARERLGLASASATDERGVHGAR